MDFVTVARVEDVAPGTVAAVEAGDEKLALANVDGRFYALQGACLHLGGPLGEGKLDANHYLTCPWHGWKYHVKTGKNDFDLAIQARTYEVRVEDGEVQVAVG
jgi:nitrite reductase (NADH) small subunit/3-phenylpropionate/trans-cinnamate dioxygenase ferredoxin subunit